MKKSRIVFIIITLLLSSEFGWTGKYEFPGDFFEFLPDDYNAFSRVKGGAGGGKSRLESQAAKHYPIIMIHSNTRDGRDWMGANLGNARGKLDVYGKFVDAAFTPGELWMYNYTENGREMRNIEELTDGLRAFISSVLWYTRSNRVQILAHGEGGVLAQATMKKYNLYNLIHAVIYIAGPFHGSDSYSYTKCLQGYPVHCNLAPGSDFLQELNIPDETPYNLSEGEEEGNFAVKYMTIYSSIPGNNKFYSPNPDSPALLGAVNLAFAGLDYDGLCSSSDTSDIFIPFLSDPAVPYNPKFDGDNDGFMGEEFGGPDCDDNNREVFPGAREIPGDNRDQDCNYLDHAPWGGRDVEIPIKNSLSHRLKKGGDR